MNIYPTNYHCPKCKQQLYTSNINKYSFVCVNCDENFYECEAILSSNLKEINIPMSLATFTNKSEQLQKLSNQYKCSFLGYDDASSLADFGWAKQFLDDSQIQQFIIDLEQILNN